jgi:hypothetical protein
MLRDGCQGRIGICSAKLALQLVFPALLAGLSSACDSSTPSTGSNTNWANGKDGGAATSASAPSLSSSDGSGAPGAVGPAGTPSGSSVPPTAESPAITPSLPVDATEPFVRDLGDAGTGLTIARRDDGGTEAPVTPTAVDTSGAGGSVGVDASATNEPPVVVTPVEDGPLIELTNYEATAHLLSVKDNSGCAVDSGNVYCWGGNRDGRLGVAPDRRQTVTLAAKKVEGLPQIAGVSASTTHSCAFSTRGSVYCWGLNDVGQVATESAPVFTCDQDQEHLNEIGDVPCQPTPTRVEGIDNAVEIAVQEGQSCARLSDGGVRCWGESSTITGWANGLSNATSFAMSPQGACITTDEGALQCSFDVPENDGTLGPLHDVVLNDGQTTYDAWGFACAFDENDELTCFGGGLLGQLGNGEAPRSGVGQPALDSPATQAALGYAHGCALSSDGNVRCWGAEALGETQLAAPNCVDSTCEKSPVLIQGLPGSVSAIASDQYQTCAISAGSVWCWGSAPVQVMAPWADGDACLDTLTQADQARRSVYFYATESCVTDEDCIAVPLDTSCNHTCDYTAVMRSGLPDAASSLADFEKAYCEPALSAGCTVQTVTCPEQNLRPICDEGYCSLDDPTRSGCDDHCLCHAERYQGYLQYASGGRCDGADVNIGLVSTCSSCDDSSIFLMLVNDGSQAFSGTVKIHFLTGVGIAVPADINLPLSLDAGAAAAPLAIVSVAAGEVYVNVSHDGDCDTSDDQEWNFSMPEPQNECQ